MATGDAAAAWTFTDVTAAAGLDSAHGYAGGMTTMPRIISGGAACGDYDGDGWDDLYVVRGDIGPNLLFRNRGDGTFEERAAAAGVALPGTRLCGPAFADLDGDGWLDLFLGGIEGNGPRLFRNRGDGTFEDVTAASGLVSVLDTFSAACGDYDRDGDLDLFLTHWSQSTGADHLWRNDGNLQFTPVDAAAGITGLTDTGYDLTFTPHFADLDGDGWADLLVAADFGTSQVFHNNGDGTFTNVTGPAITDENGMGAAVGDYDEDGDLDWFVSAIWEADGVPDGGWGVSGNRLYRNRGDGTFEDATDAAGVRAGDWGWGASFTDLDNDGDLDLLHVNGWPHVLFQNDPARVFLNNGNGTFTESAAALGLADPGMGRGIVCFDYDRDGDRDVFLANNGQTPVLYRNDGGNAGHFVDVRLRGTPPNTQGVGARVYLTAGGRTQMREVRAGCNFVSHDPVEAHFGLGGSVQVDLLRIVWPDGREHRLGPLAADQRLVLDRKRLDAGTQQVPAAGAGGVVVLGVLLVGAGALRGRVRVRGRA